MFIMKKSKPLCFMFVDFWAGFFNWIVKYFKIPYLPWNVLKNIHLKVNE